MNFARVRLVLRPRTLFEILDLALIFLRRAIPSLWPLFAVIGLIWGMGLWLVSRFSLGLWPRAALLLGLLLFLRFWLQVFLVLACGRLAFVERLRFAELFSDLREAGVLRILGSGIVRVLKWASGFALLLPLWVVLVRRFFDYEHWLLERLQGRDVGRRLLNFRTDSRVAAFRLLHLVFLGLSILIGHQLMRIALEAATRIPGPSLGTPEVLFSLFLLYDPFFIVSRFLLYIQIRTDREAWDVGLLFREGIRRTLDRRVLLVFFFPALLSLLPVRPLAAVPESDDLVPCTEAMRQQPYLKCDPSRYRSYTAEEVEKHIPVKKKPSPPPSLAGIGRLAEWMIYGGFAVVLGVLFYFLWRRFARFPMAVSPERPHDTAVKEEERVDPFNALAAAERALEQGAFREALGFAYLALLSSQPTDLRFLTPEEVRQRLLEHSAYEDGIRPFLDVYGLVFYAHHLPAADLVEPVVRNLIRLAGRPGAEGGGK